MSKVVVTARIGDSDVEHKGKSAQASYDFGDTLADTLKLFGDEVVRTNAIANIRVGLQNIMRTAIKQGLGPEQIQAKVSVWKPGMAKLDFSDPKATAMAAFNSMSPEEQAAFVKDLKAGK